MAEYLNKTMRRCLCGMLLVSPVVFAQSMVDPTRPPTTLNSGMNQELGDVTSGPVLQSVFISANRRVAMISGKTVVVGEKFGDASVASITEKEVVLRTGKEVQILKLFPGIEKRMIAKPVLQNPIDDGSKGKQ